MLRFLRWEARPEPGGVATDQAAIVAEAVRAAGEPEKPAPPTAEAPPGQPTADEVLTLLRERYPDQQFETVEDLMQSYDELRRELSARPAPGNEPPEEREVPGAEVVEEPGELTPRDTAFLTRFATAPIEALGSVIDQRIEANLLARGAWEDLVEEYGDQVEEDQEAVTRLLTPSFFQQFGLESMRRAFLTLHPDAKAVARPGTTTREEIRRATQVERGGGGGVPPVPPTQETTDQSIKEAILRQVQPTVGPGPRK